MTTWQERWHNAAWSPRDHSGTRPRRPSGPQLHEIQPARDLGSLKVRKIILGVKPVLNRAELLFTVLGLLGPRTVTSVQSGY